MEINDIAIGVDTEEIQRFENKDRVKDERFLKFIYTERELDYCFSKAKPALHLAARYCAKEAGVKALYTLGIEHVTYNKIEITNRKNGVAELSVLNHPELKTRVSMSHSKTTAVASVILIK